MGEQKWAEWKYTTDLKRPLADDQSGEAKASSRSVLERHIYTCPDPNFLLQRYQNLFLSFFSNQLFLYRRAETGLSIQSSVRNNKLPISLKHSISSHLIPLSSEDPETIPNHHTHNYPTHHQSCLYRRQNCIRQASSQHPKNKKEKKSPNVVNSPHSKPHAAPSPSYQTTLVTYLYRKRKQWTIKQLPSPFSPPSKDSNQETSPSIFTKLKKYQKTIEKPWWCISNLPTTDSIKV